MVARDYTKEDIARVVVSVLIRATHEHAFVMMKFLVKDHFPELQGTGLADEINDQILEVCLSLMDEDETFALLYESSKLICTSVRSIVNLYAIDLIELYADEHLLDVVEDFREAIILNWFPIDSDNAVYTDEDYSINLHMFSLSMMRLTHYLIMLIETGKVDLNAVADEQPFEFFEYYPDEDLKQKIRGDHPAVVRILQSLYRHQNEIFNKITDHCFRS